jgi:phosphoheptose isomerase
MNVVIVCQEIASIHSTLEVEFLYLSILEAKNSKITALTNSYRCYFHIFCLVIRLHIHFGDAMIGIAPHVGLS